MLCRGREELRGAPLVQQEGEEVLQVPAGDQGEEAVVGGDVLLSSPAVAGRVGRRSSLGGEDMVSLKEALIGFTEEILFSVIGCHVGGVQAKMIRFYCKSKVFQIFKAFWYGRN